MEKQPRQSSYFKDVLSLEVRQDLFVSDSEVDATLDTLKEAWLDHIPEVQIIEAKQWVEMGKANSIIDAILKMDQEDRDAKQADIDFIYRKDWTKKTN